MDSFLNSSCTFNLFIASQPFKVLPAMGLPVVGGIFYGQMAEGKKHLKLSQKVMHTRVYGQATVLGMLG